MDHKRITELLSPFLDEVALSDIQLGQVTAYLDLLLKWNAKFNLSAIRDPEEIIARHFGESLFAARHLLESSSVSSAIDVGSGAGFPGLPLKIWAPGLKLVLVESNHRKATFLREVARTLAFSDVAVMSRRAEEIGDKAELVTFRAVDHFERTLVTARHLMAEPGRIALLIGSAQLPQAKAAVPDLQWDAPVQIPLSTNRTLLTGTQN